ncbi:MAG: hypothetical protein PHP89_06165, partial [Candidatus Omnitrophica bacterium]|nr:hypothetical protein [Candidatus Omnitrophota bacterium]
GVVYQALGALAKAVKEEKLNPVVLDLKLLLAIAEGAGLYAWEAYNDLGDIAEAVKEEELNPVVLDLELLLAIAKGSGEYAEGAYYALGALAKAVKAKELNPVVLDLDLLLAIAEGAGESAWKVYYALGAIAEAVKKKELNPVVLDLKLLLAIAERAEIFTEVAYKALDPLAKNLQEKDFEGLLNPDLLSAAIISYLSLQGFEVKEFIGLLTEFVTEEEGLSRTNFQKRLEQYVYRMTFYKQVYDRLPGSYEELNKNTYIGVIEEQRFDVLMAYVARLAAAVKGKSEEAGREALREAISAIREEAEHSPTVEALFGGEDYDGGTREAVSREELNRVLQEILKEIDPNHREYAQSAFWSLSEAGVITADNLEQVRALLLAIAKGAGRFANDAYQSLGAIAEAVKVKDLSPVVLDLDLLLAIAKGSGESAGGAYYALGVMAKAVKEEKLNPVVLDLKLLLTIAKGSGESAGGAYYALGAITEAVKVKEMSPVVLDLNLLLVIAEGSGEYAGGAYETLGAIAEAVKVKEMSPVVLDLNLLLAIAKGAGIFT